MLCGQGKFKGIPQNRIIAGSDRFDVIVRKENDMNKNDFTHYEDSRTFEAIFSGIEVSIGEEHMSDDVLALAGKIVSKYPKKVAAISRYLSQDRYIRAHYGNIGAKEISAKLHEPIIRIFEYGGMLSYCNHELGAYHIIDVDFIGALDEFYRVNIDG